MKKISSVFIVVIILLLSVNIQAEKPQKDLQMNMHIMMHLMSHGLNLALGGQSPDAWLYGNGQRATG